MTELRVIPVRGIGEVATGDDVAELIAAAVGDGELLDRDIVVVAHKVVSKAEGRLLSDVDRRQVAVAESARVLRRAGDMTISETRHGLVCANAGVDASNVPGDAVALLPLDPDLSARRIRSRLRHLTGADVAVVVTDTFGRAWRLGQTNVAIGVAGIDPFMDYRGATDDHGVLLTATRICVADEIAAAAELVMGKTGRVCAAIVRGARVKFASGAAIEIVRRPEEDLFR